MERTGIVHDSKPTDLAVMFVLCGRPARKILGWAELWTSAILLLVLLDAKPRRLIRREYRCQQESETKDIEDE